MKRCIGILGGMSPESTVVYYEHIVRQWVARHGDHAYPEIVIVSVSFEDYIRWPAEGRWDLVAEGLAQGARRLEAAQADLVVLATNTMHRVIDAVQEAVAIPVVDLREVVADECQRRGLEVVGLLGTRWTMESPLYPEALGARGIEVLLPPADDRALVDRVIYGELVRGELRAGSRQAFLRVLAALRDRGAGGAILGCTEIPLLVDEESAGMPLLDTARLHAEAALRAALA